MPAPEWLVALSLPTLGWVVLGAGIVCGVLFVAHAVYEARAARRRWTE